MRLRLVSYTFFLPDIAKLTWSNLMQLCLYYIWQLANFPLIHVGYPLPIVNNQLLPHSFLLSFLTYTCSVEKIKLDCVSFLKQGSTYHCKRWHYFTYFLGYQFWIQDANLLVRLLQKYKSSSCLKATKDAKGQSWSWNLFVSKMLKVNSSHS